MERGPKRRVGVVERVRRPPRRRDAQHARGTSPGRRGPGMSQTPNHCPGLAEGIDCGVTRRQERWADRWAAVIVVGLGTALIAIWCAVKADGDFGEFVGRFSVLFALLGLTVLVSLWQKRSRDQAYGAARRNVRHVLDGEHSHDGIVLPGTWKGRTFRAWAKRLHARAEHRDGAELVRRAAGRAPRVGVEGRERRYPVEGRPPVDAPGRHQDQKAAFAEAGLLRAIEDAEVRAGHLRPDIRLSFRPKTSDVAYEDRSGEPSCAADLVVHLDLVRRAVDVHAAAMASSDACHEFS